MTPMAAWLHSAAGLEVIDEQVAAGVDGVIQAFQQLGRRCSCKCKRRHIHEKRVVSTGVLTIKRGLTVGRGPSMDAPLL